MDENILKLKQRLAVAIMDDLPDDRRAEFRGAFALQGKYFGFLKPRCPSGVPGIVWTEIQSVANPYKLGEKYVIRRLLGNDEERAAADFWHAHLAPFAKGLPIFDKDRVELQRLGVW